MYKHIQKHRIQKNYINLHTYTTHTNAYTTYTIIQDIQNYTHIQDYTQLYKYTQLYNTYRTIQRIHNYTPYTKHMQIYTTLYKHTKHPTLCTMCTTIRIIPHMRTRQTHTITYNTYTHTET